MNQYSIASRSHVPTGNNSFLADIQQAISTGQIPDNSALMTFATHLRIAQFAHQVHISNASRTNNNNLQIPPTSDVVVCTPTPMMQQQQQITSAQQISLPEMLAAALQHQSAFKIPLKTSDTVSTEDSSPAIRHDETIISELGDSHHCVDDASNSENLNNIALDIPQSPKSEDKRPPRKRSRVGGGLSNKTAEVWRYFDQLPPNEQGDQSARCKICDTTIKTTNSSTTGMIRHLSSCHKQEYEDLQVARIIKHCQDENSREIILRDLMNRSGQHSDEISFFFEQLKNNGSLQFQRIFGLLYESKTAFKEVESTNDFNVQRHPKHSVESIISAEADGKELLEWKKIEAHLKQYLKDFKKNTIKSSSGNERRSQKRENTTSVSPTASMTKRPTSRKAPVSTSSACPTLSSDCSSLLLGQRIKSEEPNLKVELVPAKEPQDEAHLQSTPVMPVKNIKKIRKAKPAHVLVDNRKAWDEGPSPTARNAREVDDAIAIMALFDKTEDLIEKSGFRNFVQFAFPNYEMPDMTAFRHTIFPRVEKQMGDFKAKFQQNNPFLLTGNSFDISGVSPATTVESGFIDDHDESSIAGSANRKQSFDAVIQHSYRSAQNISSEFSCSIALDNSDESGNGKIIMDNFEHENSDAAALSLACFDNSFQTDVERFMVSIGRSSDYQEKKNTYDSIFLQCPSIYRAFEQSEDLRKCLFSILGRETEVSAPPDIDNLFEFKKQDTRFSTVEKSFFFVANHYESINKVNEVSKIPDFQPFTTQQKILLLTLKDQME